MNGQRTKQPIAVRSEIRLPLSSRFFGCTGRFRPLHILHPVADPQFVAERAEN